MAWKKAWWTRIEGGNEAIARMASFNTSSALRRTESIRRFMPMQADTDLGAAAVTAGVDPATARRLDLAASASNAQKHSAILNEAGVPQSQRDPRDSQALAAAQRADYDKRLTELEAKRRADRGFFGWLRDQGYSNEMLRIQDAKSTGDKGLEEYASNKAVYADAFMKTGQQALDTVGSVLNAVTSPVSAPLSAGEASLAPEDAAQNALTEGDTSILGWTNRVGVNLVQGAARILGIADTTDAQKDDMRRAGYNPDSWTDRYGWYADIHNRNGVQNDAVVQQLKDEGKNPYKIDLVREIVTSGVDDDPARFRGLSEDAQKMLTAIAGKHDPEAEGIFKTLHADATSLGASIANNAGLTPGTGAHIATSIVGNLAAYWYLDPLVAVGGAAKAYRSAKFAVEMDPQAIKEAIALGGTTLAKRWDDVLDRVDRIHVLSQSPKAEDQALAAREFTTFQQMHADVMPLYGTLSAMREGSVVGTMFKAPAPNAKFRDAADFRTNILHLDRVSDPAQFKPAFSLRTSAADKVDQATRDAARASIAEHVGDAILADAVMKGRPLVGGKILMPGQLRVTTPVRIGLQRTTDALLGQKGKLLKQLKEAEGGVVDFSQAGGAAANLIDTAKGGEWIRQNYTRGGLRDRMAQALSRVATTRDAPVIRLDDSANTQDIYNFTRFFMPRGQAAFIAQRWATASPAVRSTMMGNLTEALGNARLALDGKASTDFWRQALKGRETPIRPGEPVREAYSHSRTADLIDTDAGPVAAAMYSTQFADGFRLPAFQEVLRNTEKVGVLSLLAGISHSRWVDKFTRIQKVGQVGTTSNMLRQSIEGRALQALDDPIGAARAWRARVGLIAETAAGRAEANTAVRQARGLANSGKLDMLTPLHATHRFDDYADEAAKLVKGGLSPQLDSLLRAGASIEEIGRGRSALRLAASRVAVDPLRRAKAAVYTKLGFKGGHDEFTYNWLGQVDDRLASKLEDAAFNAVGGQASRYMDGGVVDELDQMRDGVQNGQRLSRVYLRNTVDYLSAAGDSGAQRWGNALGIRLADPVGKVVLATAAEAALTELRVQARVNKAVAKASSPAAAAAIEARIRAAFPIPDPAPVAENLLLKSAEGEVYRLSGRRAQYAGGKFVGTDPAAKEGALKAWAGQMVEDAETYLGLRSASVAGGVVDPAHVSMLQRVAKGQGVGWDDLARIGEDFRPEAVHSRVVVGRKFVELEGNLSEKITDGASKYYQFVVSRPLARMVHEPQVVAAHHEVMAALEPVARALVDKGMSTAGVYNVLDTMAYGHAIQRVARYSDNPNVTSYFAALSNNWLWYERAMEDFARRAIQIVKADPAVVARAHLMFESAAHAGMVTKSVETDEEGNDRTEYIFAWPGSGLALRTVNEAARSLGLVDSDMVKQPVWQNLTSPVRWLSPSLQNPLGFTTTPLIGMPLRGVKALFPETTLAADATLSTLEGGERFFGSQGIVESLLPVYGKRVFNLLSADDRDSQLASATKNALIYMSAAGMLPEADAPGVDRQRALDQVREMVQNNLIMRSVAASFLPATPGTMGSNINDIGGDDLSILDRERGVTSIRGAWFQLLEDMTKRYPADSNRAFSEASAEWLRRDMGSIVDPTAFTVGTSGGPGWETDKAFTSSQELTQWMLSNKDFLAEYGQAAYRLLPALGGPYYNQVGYQVQLRSGIRQHKDSKEFYEDLVTAQANSAFYAALEQRNGMLNAAGNDKGARQRAYNWYNQYVDDLARANPVWADKQNEFRSREYIEANIVPSVRRLAEATSLPPEVAGHQDQFRLLSALYDQYREAVAKHSSPLDSDVKARKTIAKQYNARGDELFKGGPIHSLWKSMAVWED